MLSDQINFQHKDDSTNEQITFLEENFFPEIIRSGASRNSVPCCFDYVTHRKKSSPTGRDCSLRAGNKTVYFMAMMHDDHAGRFVERSIVSQIRTRRS